MTEIAVSFDDFNPMDYVDNTDLYNQPFTCRWWYPSSIHGSSKWSAHILVSISSFELVGYLEIHGTGTSKWERPYLGSLSSFYLVGAYLILPSKIRGIEDVPASAIWLSRGVSAWFDARECFVLQDFLSLQRNPPLDLFVWQGVRDIIIWFSDPAWIASSFSLICLSPIK
jgi:hypothetical protein